ncbi:GTP 3',8-cyclase MoaA [Synechocystis sp. LKSZ1]|uniref:GTP 3',8-cyclase MoaA n=1 Tax=Synechocystis sp. LKSZ1 TaxID=3144951 RepID=UPI00336BBE6E
MVEPRLIDAYGRIIRKLRLSLTDTCNLRCRYCMPVDAVFMDKQDYLSPQDYEDIVAELIDFGLEELRLTGGEPLLRGAFPEIATRLARLPLRKIGLTTNGILLDRYLDVLQDCRIQSLNISLDSLELNAFQQMTHGHQLARVLENIQKAKERGFQIKINTVMMRGLNDRELLNFVNYSRQLQIEVRFLELMRIGYACQEQTERFISAQELIDRLRPWVTLEPVASPLDSTSFNFVTPCGARLGFIASESQPFCGYCSRWRLSADGIMRACLLKSEGLSLRGLTAAQRQATYQSLLGMKPYRRPAEVSHAMNRIGG